MNVSRSTYEAEAVGYTRLTAEIVAAYVAHNNVPATDLPALITEIGAAFANLEGAKAQAASAIIRPTPSQIQQSITHEALVSFEDGKRYKILKRHLKAVGLTPDTYRRKWNLPSDYPMTSPAYSEKRSALAKGFQLGQYKP